jgi:hypothetical protein
MFPVCVSRASTFFLIRRSHSAIRGLTSFLIRTRFAPRVSGFRCFFAAQSLTAGLRDPAAGVRAGIRQNVRCT